MHVWDLLSNSEVSTESRTDGSETTDISLNAYIDAQLRSPSYPELEKIKVVTSMPGSLRYKEMVLNKLPNIPTLLIELIAEVDRKIPPLKQFCFGLSDKTIHKSDRILNALINSKTDPEFRRGIICNCSPSEIAQLIQLLFLRMENPPFIASPNFCDAAKEKGFFLTPRLSLRKDVGSTLNRVTKECLNGLSIYQQATLSYFIERCQRWCQSEVAYQIAQDPAANSTTTYTEALRFLSLLFSDCIVGLPKSYISAKLMINNCEPLEELKRHIFMLLIGIIGSHVWHGNSIETLHIPTEQSTSQSLNDSRQLISTDYSYFKSHGLHKIRSFNWL